MDKEENLGIRYLAFEGGGGRGAAYVGAIKHLAKRRVPVIKWGYHVLKSDRQTAKRVLDPTTIKGVSGASAGAITAALLAAGKDHNFFTNFLTGKEKIKPNFFFDDPKPLHCPFLPMKVREEAKEVFGLFDNHGIKLVKNASSLGRSLKILNEETLRNIISNLTEEVFAASSAPLSSLFNLFRWLISREISKEPYVVNKINSELFKYLFSFVFDMGLFTGMSIRAWVDSILKEQTGTENITFAEFHKLTSYPNILLRVDPSSPDTIASWEMPREKHNGIHLKIGGVCLNTAEVVWFDHLGPWKHMPIADAVRISLSIPGVFKPVAIPLPTSKVKKAVDLEEDVLLFVDGGVLNNLPIHAFDVPNGHSEKTVTMAEALLFGVPVRRPDKILPLNNEVLGLRLTDPSGFEKLKYSQYGNGLSMLGGVMNALLSQSETNQIRTTGEAQQTIDLDTTGLGLLSFNVDSTIMPKVSERTEKQTEEYLDKKWKNSEDSRTI